MQILAERGVRAARIETSAPPKTQTPRRDRINFPDARSLAFSQLHSSRRPLFDPKLPLLPLQTKHTAVYVPPGEFRAATQLQRRLRTGRTVEAIRAFFPKILLEDWPQNLLSEDVVFLDAVAPQFGLTAFNAYGKRQYNARMWFLRFYASLLCKQTKVEVLRFWQPCQETLLVRWSMKFRPRLFYAIYGTTLQIDGVSEMKLDCKGRIYQHRVDITDRHKIKFDLNFQPFARVTPVKATTLIG